MAESRVIDLARSIWNRSMNWLTLTSLAVPTVSNLPTKMPSTSSNPNSLRDALDISISRPNTPSNQQQTQQPAGPTLPYAFAAQFEAIQRHELFLSQHSDPHISFALPEEKHPPSELTPRPPYVHLPPHQAYPQSNGSTPIISRPQTPGLLLPDTMTQAAFPSSAGASTSEQQQQQQQQQRRPSVQRTPSYLPNPAGWSQEMNAEAIGMLETESIERVLEHFLKEHPDLKDLQGIREHLQALLIQFHG